MPDISNTPLKRASSAAVNLNDNTTTREPSHPTIYRIFHMPEHSKPLYLENKH